MGRVRSLFAPSFQPLVVLATRQQVREQALLGLGGHQPLSKFRQDNVSYKRSLGIVVDLASRCSVLPAWYFGGKPGSRLEFTKLITSSYFVNFES